MKKSVMYDCIHCVAWYRDECCGSWRGGRRVQNAVGVGRGGKLQLVNTEEIFLNKYWKYFEYWTIFRIVWAVSTFVLVG